MKIKDFPFKMGDMVEPVENYLDEQCGEFAYTGPQQITAYKRVDDPGCSGWWIQTERTKDWVDLAWFRASKRRGGSK